MKFTITDSIIMRFLLLYLLMITTDQQLQLVPWQKQSELTYTVVCRVDFARKITFCSVAYNFWSGD